MTALLKYRTEELIQTWLSHRCQFLLFKLLFCLLFIALLRRKRCVFWSNCSIAGSYIIRSYGIKWLLDNRHFFIVDVVDYSFQPYCGLESNACCTVLRSDLLKKSKHMTSWITWTCSTHSLTMSCMHEKNKLIFKCFDESATLSVITGCSETEIKPSCSYKSPEHADQRHAGCVPRHLCS